MRDCYKHALVASLAAKLPGRIPGFSHERQEGDEVNPLARPILFTRSAVDKLRFHILFASPGKGDSFEAYCGWSSSGKSPRVSRTGGGARWKHEGLFADETFNAPDLMAYLQSLSLELGEHPRVFRWKIWEPSIKLADDLSNEAAWKAEMVAEELRPVSEVVARQRVDAAVDQALTDVARIAIPWFARKMDRYSRH